MYWTLGCVHVDLMLTLAYIYSTRYGRMWTVETAADSLEASISPRTLQALYKFSEWGGRCRTLWIKGTRPSSIRALQLQGIGWRERGPRRCYRSEVVNIHPPTSLVASLPMGP
jgi:hypothetical protein